MAFFRKADAKVRLFFEPPKLFEVFFEKVSFEVVRFKTPSLFSISTHLRFSLESGCKITALQHILQIFTTLFYHFFHIKGLSRWFSKYAVEQIFWYHSRHGKAFHLNIYTRARIYTLIPLAKGAGGCSTGYGKTFKRDPKTNGTPPSQGGELNPSPYSPRTTFILPPNKGHRLFQKDDGP